MKTDEFMVWGVHGFLKTFASNYGISLQSGPLNQANFRT